MPDGTIRMPSDLLHELAERLQASGAYLSAARAMNNRVLSERASADEMIEKAAREMTGAQTILHQLREHLSESTNRRRKSLTEHG